MRYVPKATCHVDFVDNVLYAVHCLYVFCHLAGQRFLIFKKMLDVLAFSRCGTPKERQTAVKQFRTVGNPMENGRKRLYFYQKPLASAFGRQEIPRNLIQQFANSQCYTTTSLRQSELHVFHENMFFFVTLVANKLIFASCTAFGWKLFAGISDVREHLPTLQSNPGSVDKIRWRYCSYPSLGS